MNQDTNLLNLCESTIHALRNALNFNIPKELDISLNQKLFILEAALDDFKTNHAAVDMNIDTNVDTIVDTNICIDANTTIEIKHAYLEKNQNNLKKSVEAFEIDIIRAAIAKHGSKRKAATALGVDHSTLIKKCQRYGI